MKPFASSDSLKSYTSVSQAPSRSLLLQYPKTLQLQNRQVPLWYTTASHLKLLPVLKGSNKDCKMHFQGLFLCSNQGGSSNQGQWEKPSHYPCGAKRGWGSWVINDTYGTLIFYFNFFSKGCLVCCFPRSYIKSNYLHNK